MLFENSDCDLCHETKNSTLFPETPDIKSKNPADYYTAPFPPVEHFEIKRCSNCGLVRSAHADHYAIRSAFDSARQGQLNPRDETNQVNDANFRLKRIHKEFFPGCTLLDVHSGPGLFTSEAVKFGWQADGIDPSEAEVYVARRRSPWSHFYVGHIESAIFPAGSYDVITLWNVIEHTDSPRKVIERLSPWLSPGGLLVMTLPNINSFEAKIMGAQWPLLKRDSLWYFTPAAIKKLLSELGYEKIFIRPVKKKISLQTLSERLKIQKGWVKMIGNIINFPGFLKNLSVWVSTGEIEVEAKIVFH
ncbi:MAG: class I SAM-dependent methyltransferase [Anaerolineae bacterium]|nr:class I SAM-dependent methyltransferase [Anaerolineae bacterium]